VRAETSFDAEIAATQGAQSKGGVTFDWPIHAGRPLAATVGISRRCPHRAMFRDR